jgi:hypothetical protein
MQMWAKNIFPTDKKFMIDNRAVFKTPILHIFECETSYEFFPSEKIKFVCKGCQKEFFSELAAVFILTAKFFIA